MPHVPHVYLGGPWESPELPVPDDEGHHLERVLRRGEGSSVSYTNGKGVVGSGTLRGSSVHRGEERTVPKPPQLTMAVAPPHNADRARFVVEKLAELGVARLVWLATEFGHNRPPRADKAAAWSRSALQQSRGAYLLEITGLSAWDSLDGQLVVAQQREESGHLASLSPVGVTLAVGPEGGFAGGEVPQRAATMDLGPRVLRTETAAIVAAATALWLMRHGR